MAWIIGIVLVAAHADKGEMRAVTREVREDVEVIGPDEHSRGASMQVAHEDVAIGCVGHRRGEPLHSPVGSKLVVDALEAESWACRSFRVAAAG